MNMDKIPGKSILKAPKTYLEKQDLPDVVPFIMDKGIVDDKVYSLLYNFVETHVTFFNVRALPIIADPTSASTVLEEKENALLLLSLLPS